MASGRIDRWIRAWNTKQWVSRTHTSVSSRNINIVYLDVCGNVQLLCYLTLFKGELQHKSPSSVIMLRMPVTALHCYSPITFWAYRMYENSLPLRDLILCVPVVRARQAKCRLVSLCLGRRRMVTQLFETMQIKTAPVKVCRYWFWVSYSLTAAQTFDPFSLWKKKQKKNSIGWYCQ